MKLYELERGSYFRILEDGHIPPDAPEVNMDEVYKLKNLDGLYSYCLDSQGNVVHIAAYAEVVEVVYKK